MKKKFRFKWILGLCAILGLRAEAPAPAQVPSGTGLSGLYASGDEWFRDVWAWPAAKPTAAARRRRHQVKVRERSMRRQLPRRGELLLPPVRGMDPTILP